MSLPAGAAGQPTAPVGTRLTSVLGLTVPVIQAGMGGVAGPELAAAVSAAGAGGVVALYRASPAAVARLVTTTADRTTRPFGVNVIPEVAGPSLLRRQVDTALEHLPRDGFVTFFGVPPPAVLTAVAATGRRSVVQVGDTDDGERMLDRGADVLAVQGVEAGGHLLGTTSARELLGALRDRRPRAALVVAGGIATGADLARALADGADGGLAGTLFVPAAESSAHPMFRQRVLDASSTDTVVTSMFEIGWPGRRHRVLRNALTEDTTRRPRSFIATTVVDGRRVPLTCYDATAPSTTTEGEIDKMAMYCGCSCDHVTTSRTAADIVATLTAELHAASTAPPRPETTS